eukprot:8611435-Alexandrium_andersonii.AAC.1
MEVLQSHLHDIDSGLDIIHILRNYEFASEPLWTAQEALSAMNALVGTSLGVSAAITGLKVPAASGADQPMASLLTLLGRLGGRQRFPAESPT